MEKSIPFCFSIDIKKTQDIISNMKTITSRYGEKRTVKDMGGGCYVVEGPSKYYRVSSNEKQVTMYDFEGGPALWVGGELFVDDCKDGLIIEELIPEPTKSGWGKVSVVVKQNNTSDEWR
jgi:hypothetical protein